MPRGDNALAQDFGLASLLRFAWPMMAMMLFMGLYTLVDVIFVSRFVHTDALAAVNIACPAVNLIVGCGAMLATGGSAVVAREMGAGEALRARRHFTLLALGCVCLGAFIALAGCLCLEALVRGLGASEALRAYCGEYLGILLLFTPASLLQVLFQTLAAAAGRPGFGMALALGAGAVNLVLDYVFLAWLNLGVAGAALGTGFGYLSAALAGAAFFAARGGALRFCRPDWNGGVLLESCRNGSSELVSQTATAVTTFLFNGIMLRLLGEDGVAAISIVIYAQFLLSALCIGFSLGVAPVLSYCHGSGDCGRLRRVFRLCLRFVAAFSAAVCAAALALNEPLVRAFSPEGTAVCEIARGGFALFSVSFLFSGLNIFTSAAFTALSNGGVSAALSFSRTFGLLAFFLLALPRFLQTTGVWLAVPLAECAALFLSAGALWRYRKRYRYF